jgi:EF hand
MKRMHIRLAWFVLCLAFVACVSAQFARAADPDRPRLRELAQDRSTEAEQRRKLQETLTPEQRRERREEMLQRREENRALMQERLQRADKDGDGSISREEAKVRMPGVYQHFDEIDSNHDGLVSPEEIRRFWQEKAQQRRIERGARDPRF